MVFCFAVLYTVHNDPCIGKSAGYADFDLHVFVWYREFLDSLFSTDTTLRDLTHCFLGMIWGQATENRLCNTTGNAKDNTAAGTESKWHITCFRIQGCEIKTEVIDHAEKFHCCDNDICILLALGKAVWTDRFCFLGCTWHDGNHNGFLACCVFRITEVFLNDCGHHSLRGSTGGKVRNIFFVLFCDEFDPCRTAGGQKRKFLSFLNSVQEFCAFFHDGKVGTETGIINFIKSHAVKGIYNLAHNAAAFGQSVVIADCDTYCRCNLRYDTGVRICQCIPDFIHMCTDGNRSCRTEYTALSAVYALSLCNLLVECRHNHGFCSTECKSKCTDSLKFLAGTYTVAAEDTFVRVTHDGWRTEIQRMNLSRIFETDIANAETMCQFLKNALTALNTGCTISAVCCKKQFYDQFTIFLDLAGVGIDHHAVSRHF